MLVKLNLSCWNVRGLGMRRKRDDVRSAIETNLPSILCIQESKLSDISIFTASSFLPQSLRSFCFKPSVGASGGIITAWDNNLLELLHEAVNDLSITMTFSLRSENLVFTVINVYGPCVHVLKAAFLSSIEQIFASLLGPLAILGDFNLVHSPRDKSNGNINSSEAASFNGFINNLGLLEISLVDRQFTWSNQQNPPILARLDRILVNPEWSFTLPYTTLSSFVCPTSDHIPLHISAATKAPKSTVFWLENSWLSNHSIPPIISSN
jgi:exonuclease III